MAWLKGDGCVRLINLSQHLQLLKGIYSFQRHGLCEIQQVLAFFASLTLLGQFSYQINVKLSQVCKEAKNSRQH